MKTGMVRNVGMAVILFALAAFSAQAQDHKGKDGHGRHQRDMHHGKEGFRAGRGPGNFAAHVVHITGVDSAQALKLKPTLDKTAKRLEALRAKFQAQEKLALDSLGVQLKKQLTEEQYRRWDDFRYHQGERQKDKEHRGR